MDLGSGNVSVTGIDKARTFIALIFYGGREQLKIYFQVMINAMI